MPERPSKLHILLQPEMLSEEPGDGGGGVVVHSSELRAYFPGHGWPQPALW